MRRQCDVVVVLLHEGPGDAKRMAAEVPGIDVLVVGHSPGYQFVPDRVGETVLVRAGNRGQYMMALDVTVGADGSVVEIKGEGKPLGEAVPKDPAFAPEVAAWEAKHPKKK
jgi:2',3'-cyclic-nucleotide 2'-phosphodiesterase (5'-nucleotidase family)